MMLLNNWLKITVKYLLTLNGRNNKWDGFPSHLFPCLKYLKNILLE